MDRGQAHTLEAFAAALLVVSGVVFALQATAVTPLSASTSNQHIENQQRAMAEDVLVTAHQNGALEEAVLAWNESSNSWIGTEEKATGHFVSHGPPNEFGTLLNETFLDDRIAFNVFVHHRTPGNDSSRETMVYMGTPSDNAASGTATVGLRNDDTLVNSTTTVEDADFYAGADAHPDGELFTTVEVEVVVWRM